MVEEKTRFGILSTVTGHCESLLDSPRMSLALSATYLSIFLRKQGSLRCPLTSRPHADPPEDIHFAETSGENVPNVGTTLILPTPPPFTSLIVYRLPCLKFRIVSSPPEGLHN